MMATWRQFIQVYVEFHFTCQVIFFFFFFQIYLEICSLKLVFRETEKQKDILIFLKPLQPNTNTETLKQRGFFQVFP